MNLLERTMYRNMTFTFLLLFYAAFVNGNDCFAEAECPCSNDLYCSITAPETRCFSMDDYEVSCIAYDANGNFVSQIRKQCAQCLPDIGWDDPWGDDGCSINYGEACPPSCHQCGFR